MGLFDKLKNVFIEDEIIEQDEVVTDVVKENVKEEVVPNTSIDEVPKHDDVDEISDRSLVDTKENFKFPIIFEEDDFKEEKKKSKSINVLERENNKYEPEIKKNVTTAKKTFKPSPVISPVYGVLDKNYKKDEISSKDGLLNDSSDKIDIDYVIKKAYGTNDEVTVVEDSISISDKEIDLFANKEDTKEIPINTIDNETLKEELDEKIKSIDDLLKDTNDEDFYSLVDSMYKDEEDI